MKWLSILFANVFYIFLIWLCWNWVVPSITGFSSISIWETVVLLLIVRAFRAKTHPKKPKILEDAFPD